MNMIDEALELEDVVYMGATNIIEIEYSNSEILETFTGARALYELVKLRRN